MIFAGAPGNRFSQFQMSRPKVPQPQLIKTSYRSQNFHPFVGVMGPVRPSRGPGLPQMPRRMNPSYGSDIPTSMPAVTPAAPAATPPPQAQSAAMSGAFGGGGRGGSGVSVYRIMKLGLFPGVRANAGNVMQRVRNAGGIVQSMSPRGNIPTPSSEGTILP